MNDVITTSELVALVIRNIKKIIIISLATALLFACAQVSPFLTKSPEALASEQDSYTQAVRKLEESIAREDQKVASEKAYIEASTYMQLDPYDLYVSTISFSIINQVFQDEPATIGYLTGEIITRYLALWNAFDLPSQLGLPEYEDAMDKYVRELVSICPSGNSIITIQAIGATAQQADQLVASAYTLLTAQKETVSGESYPHDVSLLSHTTKNIIDQEMLKTQQYHLNSINTYSNNIDSAKRQLQELSSPSLSLASVAKMTVIGGIIGFVVSSLLICFTGILRTPLLSSQQLERTSDILFLGSLHSHFNFIKRMAYNVAKEQMWASQEQALLYIAQKVSHLSGKTVLLTSSLPLPLENPSVRALFNLLESRQIHVLFAADYTHNPAALEYLGNCEEVCLIESIGLSDMASISKVTDDIKRSNHAILGFVLI